MNARQVAEHIASTCESLYAIKLVRFYNTPHEVTANGRTRISWRSSEAGSGHQHPFGSLEQYLGWVKGGEFTCILFDNSLVRASYVCEGNSIVEHTLWYWPCPVKFPSPAETLNDLCDGLAMCIESPRAARDICELSLRSPMRFDFDPQQEREDHPLVHLHMQFEEARLHVNEAMCFTAFIKKVFRTFYLKKWLENRDVELLHEQPIDQEEGQFDPMPHCLQVSWC
ncbi:MAG: DUF2290 domain-containing protein [Bacillota bacterium]